MAATVVLPKRKMLFALCIAVNVGILAYFKYSGLLAQMFNSLCRHLAHYDLNIHLTVILPLGISFFTFEFLHYLFEIYRGNAATRSFWNFALFAAFFPTQIAGPIKRYPDFVAQIDESKNFDISFLENGLLLIVIGFAKKVFLANNLALLGDISMSNPGQWGTMASWIFAYAFAFQLYFDFSGYTDIARGSALLLGYRIPDNFNLPFFACNIADFWRRWHISLSLWLRDYLFIPLGGSRHGELNTSINLVLTMVVCGLWHAASWNMVLFGLLHGLGLSLHRCFVKGKESVVAVFLLDQFDQSIIWRVFSIIITFNFFCLSTVFFRSKDIHVACTVIKQLLFLSGHFGLSQITLFLQLPTTVASTVGLLLLLMATNWPISFLQTRGLFRRLPSSLKGAYCSILIVCLLLSIPEKQAPFIYFQF